MDEIKLGTLEVLGLQARKLGREFLKKHHELIELRLELCAIHATAVKLSPSTVYMAEYELVADIYQSLIIQDVFSKEIEASSITFIDPAEEIFLEELRGNSEFYQQMMGVINGTHKIIANGKPKKKALGRGLKDIQKK